MGAGVVGDQKRGDRYLRSPRSVLQRAAQREDRLSRWATRLKATRGTHKATVALANKMARIGWVVVREHTVFRAA